LWLKLSYKLYVKRFKIHCMVIRFFCIHQSHKNITAPTRGLSNGHDAQETIEALQTAFR
jgi:hypothetical protein